MSPLLEFTKNDNLFYFSVLSRQLPSSLSEHDGILKNVTDIPANENKKHMQLHFKIPLSYLFAAVHIPLGMKEET